MAQPKHVRNAWIEVHSNARKEPLGTGPIGEAGALLSVLKLREHGKISDTQLVTYVEPTDDGLLRVTIVEQVKVGKELVSRKVYDRLFER